MGQDKSPNLKIMSAYPIGKRSTNKNRTQSSIFEICHLVATFSPEIQA